MKFINKNKGITLIALVITIVILLILSGIAINQLAGENGLFARAKEAKQKTLNAQNEENAILEDYLAQINEEAGINILANKVKSGEIKIGDYMKYQPDTLDTNSEEYKTLVSNWGETYSGSTNNSSSNLIQDTTLNWRVLDVQDGKVRLISDKPTSNTVTLSGYQGYNNAVYLLDTACSTLYNSRLASKVQSLKIEDIERYMKTKPTEDTTVYSPTNMKYPSILAQEENQIVNDSTGTFAKSKQGSLINQTEELTATTLNLRKTYWYQYMTSDSFTDQKYYELFMKNWNDYSIYWLSSRSINIVSDVAWFDVRCVVTGSRLDVSTVYNSTGEDWTQTFAIRPIITLNSNVQIDTTKSGDGTSAETAYAIK